MLPTTSWSSIAKKYRVTSSRESPSSTPQENAARPIMKMAGLTETEKKDSQLAITTVDGKTLFMKELTIDGQNEKEALVSTKYGTTPSWKDLILDWTQSTTLHGVPYITQADSVHLRRFLWLILVLSVWGILIFYATDRFIYYFQFNKNVNVEVNYLEKVQFPAVTICNQNTFKITSLADNGWYHIVQTLFTNTAPKSSSRRCVEGERRCKDASACIPVSYVCDLFPDCGDGSDEEYCDQCPLVRMSGPSDLEKLHPTFVNKNFAMQPNTLISDRPLYVHESNRNMTFLYYTNNEWRIGEMFGDSQPLAYAINSVGSPERVTNAWYIREKSGYVFRPDFRLTCQQENMELLAATDFSSPPGLNLSYLYQATGHTQLDFIQGCKWKGEKCRSNAIQEKLTDMGICYQFNDPVDMKIEQAGPGKGLSLTLNIEFYEYTKDTSDGVGVKILMHEKSDFPMVAEQGISVSPGLYSFISVETTEVGNLPPPWGLCGETDLTYFDSYSIAKCKVDCETNLAYDDCGCRDFYQPNDKKGNPPVCQVEKYITCTAVKIEEYRKSGNFCKCPSPCAQVAYVPTTSFAIVLSSNNADESEKDALQHKLVKARETSYRIIKSNYLETMRQFHIMFRQMTFLRRFCQISSAALEVEFQDVFDISSRLTSDCAWYRSVVTEVSKNVTRFLHEPFATYRMAWRQQLINRFISLVNTVEETLYEYQSYVSTPSMSSEEIAEKHYQRLALINRQNKTFTHMYTEVQDAITLLEDELLQNLEVSVATMPAEMSLRLQESRYKPMQTYVSPNCPGCFDIENTPVTEILRASAEVTMDQVKSVLTWTRGDLTRLYDTYLRDLTLMTNMGKKEKITFRAMTTEMLKRLQGISDLFQDNIDALQGARNLLHDLLEYTWRGHCQFELMIHLDEYQSVHQEMVTLFKEVSDYMEERLTQWGEYRNAYNTRTKRLQNIAQEFPFTNVQTLIDRKETRLETIINKRKQVLLKIQNHVQNTVYLLMMVLDDDAMATNSALWEKFQAAIPTLIIPESRDDEEITSQPGASVQLSSEEQKYWDDIQEELDALANNLDTQTAGLRTITVEALAFFKAYVDGNKISAEFYEKNFLQVELFYKELTERKVSQQAAYSYTNLLSEIGGLMGLLLGASVLSFMEILDLFFYNSIRKCVDFHRARVHPSPMN